MFLLIDKPKGVTSHDVVDRIRDLSGERRIGHAGTLDPNATGLLIIGVGRESTRKLSEIARGTRKTYIAEIVLGEERTTDDAEGSLVNRVNQVRQIDEVKKVLKSFVGQQEQVPPTYSAIKVGGKKAYEIARKGGKVKLKPRKIMVYSIKLVGYDYPKIKIKTEVSSGTYIRALARDIGRKLGTGAYLSELRRIKIGKFDVKQAILLKFLTKNNWLNYTVSSTGTVVQKHNTKL